MSIEDVRDYQRLRAWLRGDKPPAVGRTWHRAATALLPPAVVPYVGKGVGLAVVGGLALVGGFAIPLGLFLEAPALLDLVMPALATPPMGMPGGEVVPFVRAACHLIFRATGVAIVVVHVWHLLTVLMCGGRR